MFNCVKLISLDSEGVSTVMGIFPNIETAEYFRDLFPECRGCTWKIDWAYIPNIGF